MELASLAAQRRFDYVVVESTGISEPMQVAETFSLAVDEGMRAELEARGFALPAAPAPAADDDKRKKNDGKAEQEEEQEGEEGEPPLPLSLSSFARLDTCVTVVDAAAFYDDLTSIEELADR